MMITIWGPGGYDPEKPNNNIIEQYEVADPEPTELDLARASAVTKLRDLGLTDAEITAITGYAL
jgi:hypothetical protein